MLFVSGAFLLYFLPAVMAGYFLFSKLGTQWGRLWLVAASFFFYGYAAPRFVLLLAASILCNYLLGRGLSRSCDTRRGRVLLWCGLALNLGLLCFYKYLPPLTQALHRSGILSAELAGLALPLGISFFTFLQIGYLIDLADGTAEPASLLNYSLFVSFFPHLISGPIVSHKEIMPQLCREERSGLSTEEMLPGFSLFILGLAKKLLIADRIAALPDAAFAAPQQLGALQAWVALLLYVLQLYFDFSGYSDMAIGLARIFGLRYPANFNSPLKARNISDFWQRWHITLTRFLNGYLYNPVSVAINRRRIAHGKAIGRKALATPSGFAAVLATPILFTMLAIGIWHGAGWQFALFGLLHGFYLCVYHAWRVWPLHARADRVLGRMLAPCSIALTTLAVALAFVLFRSSSVTGAGSYYSALAGLHGLRGHVDERAALLIVLYPAVWLIPNSQEILGDTSAEFPSALQWLRWKPCYAWSIALGLLCLFSLFFAGESQSFVYFRF